MKCRIAELLLFLTVAAPLAFCGQITVSPAALSMKGAAGQISTQKFRVQNLTDSVYEFSVDVADVQVHNGTRLFVPPEQAAASLASMSTALVTGFELRPGEEKVVPVTFVLPSRTSNRAVAVFFRGLPVQAKSGIRIRLNLGVVVDFTISDQVDLRIAEPTVSQPTQSTNAVISQQLSNEGPEPANVRGIAAILGDSGRVVGKAAFDHRRLLPGEHDVLRAEYAGTLASGHYRILSTLEYAGTTVTKAAELTIP